MKEITIYRPEGGELITTTLLEESYHYARIQEIDTVTLAFETARHTEIPLGAFVTWRDRRYALMRPSDLVMHHSERYEYRVTLYGDGERLKLYKLTDSDGRAKFTLTARPQEHLDLLLRAIQAKEPDGKWTAGNAPEGAEVTVAYNGLSIFEALGTLASALKTEWAVLGTTLHIGKLIRGDADPLALSYGEGRGFLPDIRRTAEDGSYPAGRVYIESSDRNIDPAKYGAKTLRFPENATRQGYTVTRDYVERAEKDGIAAEETIDGSDIYPSKEGAVTAVETTAEGFFDIIDAVNDIDFSALLIPGGEPLTVAFQSGMLAGREAFEATYVHSEKRFKLVSREEDGITIPGGALVPKEGDRYAVFGMMLPEEYIAEAENRLLDRAVQFLEEHKAPSVTIRGDIDPIWAEKNWATVAPRLALGGFVSFSDPEWQPDPVLIRITGIKTFLAREYAPTIELSNAVTPSAYAAIVRTLEAQEVYREESEKRTLALATERSYKQAEALAEALEKNLGASFDDKIRPIALHTMQVLVGDPSLQFLFVESPSTTKEKPLAVTRDAGLGTIRIPESFLQHRTIGLKDPDASKPDRPASDYKTWTIDPLAYTPKEETQLYLYARVPKDGDRGSFLLAETPRTLEEESGYYNLWCGIYYPATGEYLPMHGFAELTPSRLTIGRMQSPDGQSWIDWAKGSFHFQSSPDSYLDINTLGDGKLRIKGGLITVGSSDQTIEEAIREQDEKRQALDQDRPAVWSLEIYDVAAPLAPAVFDDKLAGYRTQATYAFRLLRSGKDVTEWARSLSTPPWAWRRRNPTETDDDGLSDTEWENIHSRDLTVTLTLRDIAYRCDLSIEADSDHLETLYKSKP